MAPALMMSSRHYRRGPQTDCRVSPYSHLHSHRLASLCWLLVLSNFPSFPPFCFVCVNGKIFLENKIGYRDKDSCVLLVNGETQCGRRPEYTYDDS